MSINRFELSTMYLDKLVFVEYSFPFYLFLKIFLSSKEKRRGVCFKRIGYIPLIFS